VNGRTVLVPVWLSLPEDLTLSRGWFVGANKRYVGSSLAFIAAENIGSPEKASISL
jgi:hypothetical protein